MVYHLQLLVVLVVVVAGPGNDIRVVDEENIRHIRKLLLAGDGVRFAVDVSFAGAPPVEIYALRLNPRANEDERRWVEVRVPLGPYAGRTIDLTLRTDPVDDVRNDWAGWGNPMVVVDHTVLRPSNGPVVPASVGPRPLYPR